MNGGKVAPKLGGKGIYSERRRSLIYRLGSGAAGCGTGELEVQIRKSGLYICAFTLPRSTLRGASTH